MTLTVLRGDPPPLPHILHFAPPLFSTDLCSLPIGADVETPDSNDNDLDRHRRPWLLGVQHASLAERDADSAEWPPDF